MHVISLRHQWESSGCFVRPASRSAPIILLPASNDGTATVAERCSSASDLYCVILEWSANSFPFMILTAVAVRRPTTGTYGVSRTTIVADSHRLSRWMAAQQQCILILTWQVQEIGRGRAKRLAEKIIGISFIKPHRTTASLKSNLKLPIMDNIIIGGLKFIQRSYSY